MRTTWQIAITSIVRRSICGRINPPRRLDLVEKHDQAIKDWHEQDVVHLYSSKLDLNCNAICQMHGKNDKPIASSKKILRVLSVSDTLRYVLEETTSVDVKEVQMNIVLDCSADELLSLRDACTQKDIYRVEGPTPNYLLVEDLIEQLGGGGWAGYGVKVDLLAAAGYDVDHDHPIQCPENFTAAHNRLRLALLKLIDEDELSTPSMFDKLFLRRSVKSVRAEAIEKISHLVAI